MPEDMSKHATITISISAQELALLCSLNEFEFERICSQRFTNESAKGSVIIEGLAAMFLALLSA